MNTETLEEYQKRMSYENRVRTQAIAILQRAERAKIPKKFLRINQEEFKNLLCAEFHKNPEEVAKKIYENAKSLFQFDYLVIDGGSFRTRREAGFALLFRLIACDKIGYYTSFNDLSHELEDALGRQEISRDIKKYDVLYLGEFQQEFATTQFLGFDAGGFFDSILESREDRSRPTIISFVNPVSSQNTIKTNEFGHYIAELSKQFRTNDRVLRIRVKG
jgi:hypothetical protein